MADTAKDLPVISANLRHSWVARSWSQVHTGPSAGVPSCQTMRIIFLPGYQHKTCSLAQGSRDHPGENREGWCHLTKAKSNADCHLIFLATYIQGYLTWGFNQGRSHFSKMPLLFVVVVVVCQQKKNNNNNKTKQTILKI